MKFRWSFSKTIDQFLPQRSVQGYYNFGANDAFPTELKVATSQSPTAQACLRIQRDILLRHLGAYEHETHYKFLTSLVNDYLVFGGAYVHINYNLDLKISSIQLLAFERCRIGKIDDKRYSGKVGFKNWKDRWEDFYTFNPDPEVIRAQIRKDGGLAKYRGQVLVLNLSNELYPISPLLAAYKSIRAEAKIETYKINLIDTGYIQKKIFIVPETGDGAVRDDSFATKLEQFMGADNAGNVCVLHTENTGEETDKLIKVVDIPTSLDDKLFNHTELSSFKNITRVMNIPSILVNGDSDSLFSHSGELMLRSEEILEKNLKTIRNNLNIFLLTRIDSNSALPYELKIPEPPPKAIDGIIPLEEQVTQPVNKPTNDDTTNN